MRCHRPLYVPVARRTSQCWDDDAPVIAGTTVYEPDDAPVDTGLLDQHGVPLYRVVRRNPIGFHRR